MPAPRLLHFNVFCIAAPYNTNVAPPNALILLRVAVPSTGCGNDILVKLAKHTEAPSGFKFEKVRIKGRGIFLDEKAILEDVVQHETELEAFMGEVAKEEEPTEPTEPLRLVKQEPIDRIDMVLRLMQNRSDEQRTLRSRSVRSRPKRPKCPKLIGAVKRIVATTKEYVESLKFCMRSGEVISHGKEEEKPDQKELKYACFYLEEEELLQEVEQLMDRDAPPDTLGVEILLRTSKRDLTISGAAKSRPPPNVVRKCLKAPAGRQIRGLIFANHEMVGYRHHRSVPKYIKKNQKRARRQQTQQTQSIFALEDETSNAKRLRLQ